MIKALIKTAFPGNERKWIFDSESFSNLRYIPDTYYINFEDHSPTDEIKEVLKGLDIYFLDAFVAKKIYYAPTEVTLYQLEIPEKLINVFANKKSMLQWICKEDGLYAYGYADYKIDTNSKVLYINQNGNWIEEGPWNYSEIDYAKRSAEKNEMKLFANHIRSTEEK